MNEKKDYVGSLEDDWRQKGLGAETLHYAAALRLIRAGRLLEARLSEISSVHGLAVRGDYEALAALRRHSLGLTPGGLAERTMLTTAGMTGRLDRLEAEELVERRSHPVDRRSVIVSITDAGEELAKRIFEESIATVRDVLFASTTVDLTKFNRDLSELLMLLEPNSPTAGLGSTT